MRPLTVLWPVPGTLCAFLLLGGALSTQQEEGKVDWDSPTCTQDPVTVPRGQQAVMTCNISNTYTEVIIFLTSPGGHSKKLFHVKAPDCISKDGWQLLVQDRVAQLLVAKADSDQAGTYTWTLQGKQWEQRKTILCVTESQDPPLTPVELKGMPSAPPVGSGGLPGYVGAEETPHPAADSLRALPENRLQSGVFWSFAFAALCVLVLFCVMKGRRGQWTQFSAAKFMKEEESDHMQLTSGLQP
ncbi:secreted and transmembrane protein 1 [Sorex fumeus]|uniref:secreted and transmembrane protein 1 n=1 Tax=Sorex fumeus TaxID=62283 RepID=UPI0024ADF3CC|nr:secreted and transmembrane protein 1 [Sorex fumeus]XP_055971622.1 secreted and transmembrane protein 1 [Sorex fumeus]